MTQIMSAILADEKARTAEAAEQIAIAQDGEELTYWN